MSDNRLVPSSAVSAEEELFRRNLPLSLLSALERRYLANLKPSDWTLEVPEITGHRPLLRPILALSRPRHPYEFVEAIPHVLSACNSEGHALVMVIDALSPMRRLWVGGRRLAGAVGSTEEYLGRVGSAFRAGVPGLVFGDIQGLDHRDLPGLSGFLRTAPKLSVLTGLPSRRKSSLPFPAQSLDQLIAAAGNHRYAVMIVAEPVPRSWMDASIDACRELKSEAHSYLRRSVQRSRGESSSAGSSAQAGTSSWVQALPMGLYGLVAFLGMGGLVAAPALAALQSGAAGAMMLSNHLVKPQTTQSSHSESLSEATTIEILNANAQACVDLLDRHLQRLQSARAFGWWRVAVYLASETDSAQASLSGALRSMSSGDSTYLEPMRILDLPTETVRAAAAGLQILSLKPKGSPAGHPLGPSFDSLSTCMQSEDLAVLFTFPQRELPGLPIREHAEFAVATPPATVQGIELGQVVNALGERVGSLDIPVSSLNRHVFVSGMTGFGKTNTCMRILVEAWRRYRIPFLVIEPAKGEYRDLARTADLEGLCCFGIGQNSRTLSLRLNPLSPVPGTPIAKHIDLLKAVFNAAFPMHPGMPYILEEALIEVYAERGWDLSDSGNRLLGQRSSLDTRSALTPNLEDLHDKIEQVLERKKYGQEIHQNLGAAMRSRIRSLMVGNKGATLNTRRSTSVTELFASPAIVELKELGDDEEKCFVMALLFVLLYEHCEQRREVGGRLLHLTLIEEAHRLLAGRRGSVAAEVADPRTKAVTMFADLLAEIRAYGEGFLIADQVPSDLAPQALKNTGLKIIHRLSAADDRQAVGACANLNESQIRYLNHLSPGEAAVHDERIGEAVLIHVPLAKPAPGPPVLPQAKSDVRVLYRHSGCRECAAPCIHPQAVDHWGPQPDPAFVFFLESLLESDDGVTEAAFRRWSLWWRSRQEERSGPAGALLAGQEYCYAAQRAHQWAGTWLSARRAAAEGTYFLTPQDRLRRESVTASLGSVIAALQRGVPLSGEKARLEMIRTGLAGEPARELPACGSCPARCRMVGLVGNLAATAKSAGALRTRTTPEEALLFLERIAEPVAAKAIPNAGRTLRRHWMYCFAAHLEDNLPPAISEQVFSRLRSPGPATDELQRIAGV